MSRVAKLLGILVFFPMTMSYAAQFTWTGLTSSDLTEGTNWNLFVIPTDGDGTLFDNTAVNFTPTISSTSLSPLFQVDLVEIDNTLLLPGQYSFHIKDNTKFNLIGSVLDPSGIKIMNRMRSGITPVGVIQNFYIDNGGLMEFDRDSQADIGYSFADYQLPPFINYTMGSSGLPGFMNFNGNSQGGAAGYYLHNGSGLTFDNFSLAGLPQIHMDSGSVLNFTKLSSGGAANIDAKDSTIILDTAANAFFATFNLDNTPISFIDGSNVGSATINAINGSPVVVQDFSLTSGRATISLTDSPLIYKGTADAGQSTILANNSSVSFQDTSRLSSLGTISLSNNSSLVFADSSDAGITKISADASTVTFGNFNNSNPFPNSDNASVVLNNGSVLTMNNFANLLNINVLDPASIINFNNFLSTPMTFSTLGLVTNGHININPFGPTASGSVAFTNTFNSYQSLTVHRGDLIGSSLNIVGNIVNNGNIIFNQVFSQSFFGNISGPGNVILQGGSSMLVEGANSISASTMQVIGENTVLDVEPANLTLGTLFIGDGASVNFETQVGEMQSFNGLILDMPGEHGAGWKLVKMIQEELFYCLTREIHIPVGQHYSPAHYKLIMA